MHSVASYCLLPQKNELVLHDNFNDLMLSSRNSSIYNEIIATLPKDIYRNCEISASQSFPNPTYHTRRSNRMQPNKIARWSIYSRGVLAVVGKAEFFRLRFKESSCAMRTTAAVTKNRPSEYEEETLILITI